MYSCTGDHRLSELGPHSEKDFTFRLFTRLLFRVCLSALISAKQPKLPIKIFFPCFCYYFITYMYFCETKKLSFIWSTQDAIHQSGVLSSCTGSQEPIQKNQQCSTAKQRFINKGVQWLFPLCTSTPGHNRINY